MSRSGARSKKRAFHSVNLVLNRIKSYDSYMYSDLELLNIGPSVLCAGCQDPSNMLKISSKSLIVPSTCYTQKSFTA